MRKSLITALILVLTGLLALEFNSVYAHGDESHGGESHSDEKKNGSQLDLTEPLKTMSIIQFKQKFDSINAIVSATYVTVEPMLKNSCYDCHSDQTNYPWYYKIPTIDAMIDSDIKEARKHIDFSNGFPFGGHADQLKQLAAIRKEVEEGEMPLISYQLMHWGSVIEGEQRDTLFKWIDESTAVLKAAYDELGLFKPKPANSSDDNGQ